MKALALLAWLVVAAGLVSGCSGSSKVASDAPQTYLCPSCKEQIQWKSQPGKPWVTTGKEVVHTCPTCKKEWSSNLASTSTCQECQTKALVCPICKQHG